MANKSRIPVSKDIIVCNLCKGEGSYQINTSVSSFYDEETVDCWQCNKTGKIVRTVEYVLKTTERPYEE